MVHKNRYYFYKPITKIFAYLKNSDSNKWDIPALALLKQKDKQIEVTQAKNKCTKNYKIHFITQLQTITTRFKIEIQWISTHITRLKHPQSNPLWTAVITQPALYY